MLLTLIDVDRTLAFRMQAIVFCIIQKLRWWAAREVVAAPTHHEMLLLAGTLALAARPHRASSDAHKDLGNLDYRSVGKLKPLTKVLDMADRGVPRKVAAARSYRGEIMLFTSDAGMAGWSFHFVHQMRAQGYEHWLILADKKKSCIGIHEQWSAVERKHGDQALSCVYTSYPRSHPGWKQWRPGGGRREDVMHNVYILWGSRWWVALKLLRQNINVLSLDVDAVLLTDIYQLLRSPPLSRQDVIITRNDDGSQSLNCGFVYFNRDAHLGAFHPGQREQQAIDAATCGGGGSSGEVGVDGAMPAVAAAAVPAAEWVAELMWERVRLFLEINRAALSKPPAREVLWEQDAWNDLAKSLELRRRVFPWVTGYGKDSDLWQTLGYQRTVLNARTHPEKWVAWRKMSLAKMPPFAPDPAEAAPARRFHETLRAPMLWLPLCPPANMSSRAAVVPPPGETRGIPLGIESEVPLRAGRMLVAPSWLASLGNDPEPDWAGAKPSPLAYVHITNMWKCFPHPCWSKAGRLFWLRAHGFWDRRLDDLGLTPRGRPYDERTRVLALPPQAFDAIGAVGEELGGGGSSPTPERTYGFRRLAALVHNLVTVAALIGRKPVIPQVPCSFVRNVQSAHLHTVPTSRFGICHASVVTTGPADQPTCHLTPGTWRPGGPDQCYHSAIMSQFDLPRFLEAHGRGAPNGSVRVRGMAALTPAAASSANDERGGGGASYHVTYSKGALDLAPLHALCKQASAQAELPLLQLDGLLPLQDGLIDRPLPPREFETEQQRQRSKRPRWPSLLMNAELRQLADSCPGARDLIQFRKQCVGYFLAE